MAVIGVKAYHEWAMLSSTVAARSIDGRGRIKDFRPLIELAYKACGSPVPLTYDLEPENPEECVWNTMLARLGYYLAWLYRERGLLKNQIVLLEGPGGSGKTTIAYWAAKVIYDKLGWKVDHTYFMFLDADSILSIADEYRPVIVLDDVGSIITKYWVFLKGERRWAKFFSIMDQAKDFSSLIILTARSSRSVAARLREIVDYTVEVREIMIANYVLTIMMWRRPDSKIVRFVDVVPPTLKLPPEVWKWMMEMRRRLREERLKALEEGVEE